MKKFFSLMIGLLFMSQVAIAQTVSLFDQRNDAHWAVGVQVGTGFNWASGPLGGPHGRVVPKTQIGIMGEYAFTRFIAIQSNLMIGLNHGFERENYRLTWTTLDWDLMLLGRIPLNNWFAMTFGAGLSVNTGLGRLNEVRDGVESRIRFADNDLNAVAMGIILQLGYEFTLPHAGSYMGFSIRSDWKFSRHYKELTLTETDRPRGSIHTPFSVMVFYGHRWNRERLGFL